MTTGRFIGMLGLTAAAFAVSACEFSVGTTSAASLSCDQLAERARAATQTQGTPVTAITGITEVSATPSERRCTGTAETAQGSTTVHFRGRASDDNVEIREAPFE